MGFTPIKTPKVAKKLFPNYVWDIATKDKTIYLTFDDGPTPEITNWTLSTLKAYNAKATFFCIGNNIEKHPDIFQNILKEGHTIGNHTYNHVKGWKTNSKVYLQDVDETRKLIHLQLSNSKFQNANSKAQISPNHIQTIDLFRPPYGQIKPKQGQRLIQAGYEVIMWDVLSFDWDKTTPKETCLNHVISKTTKGSIIVFHDSVKASKNMQYALPKVLKHFSELGYCFESITSNLFKKSADQIA